MNWRRGASLSTSSYSKFLFSDDLLGPSYLEKCLPYLSDPACGLVYTSVNIADKPWGANSPFYNNFIGNTKIRRSPFIYGATFIENFFPVSPCACVCRTEDLQKYIFTNVPGFESELYSATGAGVDLLLYCMTALNYGYIQYVEDCEVYFRAHSNSMSAQDGVPTLYENARTFLKSTLIASG
ncbi:MAG: hypothetical protein EBR87_09015 [Cytophagia bacterium]|nr:hypothetical protein [Cytophagia bacterium]